MSESDQAERAARRWRPRPEKWWWITLVVVVPVVLLTGITTHPDNANAQIELVKTALSVGAGTGGVVALVLAGRRQWHVEEAQRATVKSHQLAEHDAAERRITELYGRAVEQLGSDRAPVRLGGLYALERLAQDNPGQWQTIVNVLCAYLRMPFEFAGEPPAADTDEVLAQQFVARATEQQVRLAAQDILGRHLAPGDDSSQPLETFWPETDLDLNGATLVNFTLAACRVRATN